MLRESEKSSPRRGHGGFLCILGPSKTWASSLALLGVKVNFSSGYTHWRGRVGRPEAYTALLGIPSLSWPILPSAALFL